MVIQKRKVSYHPAFFLIWQLNFVHHTQSTLITNRLSNNQLEYFWLGGPWLSWWATLAYLIIVLKVGPDFMRDRKPYSLKTTIRLYNLLLVAINTYLFVGSLISFNYGLDFWGCGEALSTRKRHLVLHYGHLFFHTRYLEFFDTFFFILRKKNSQLSFLHIFHHAIVPSLMYFGLKFHPLPFNSMLPLTNMFVHIIMYAYYGLATFPEIQKYLWWKKYLTTMQITQFAVLLIQSMQPFVYYAYPECQFPMDQIYMNIGIALTFLGLFVSFYRRTYAIKKPIGQDSATRQIKSVAANGARKQSISEASRGDFYDSEARKVK